MTGENSLIYLTARFPKMLPYFSKAQEGKAELRTSAFTLAEVYKRKCNGDSKSLPEGQDDYFESLFESGLVKPILLDIQVAQVARRLSRKYPVLRKPQDAIHVASCFIANIDEMHTFDVKDLIRLDRQIPLKNGNALRIIKPPQNKEPGLFENG